MLELDNNYHNTLLTNCICVNKLHGMCITNYSRRTRMSYVTNKRRYFRNYNNR